MFINPNQNVINFIKALLDTYCGDLITWINTNMNNIQAMSNSGFGSFLSAFIDTFIPWQVILACVAIRVPLAGANLVWALVLRIKSFIPTMGH